MNLNKSILIICFTALLFPPGSTGADTRSDYNRPEWTVRGEVLWGGNLHEPLAFYRRENRPMAGISAEGLWLEDWYDKVRSEETISRLAAAGANLIYLNFAKGAGGDPEFEDLGRAREVVERCHRHGIRVLPYIQFASKHAEEFFPRRPEARSWLMTDPEGRPRTYGNRYYRKIMCPMNPEYVQYLKQLIHNAVAEFGFDGVFLDNCYYDNCYCEHCQKSFKDYVKSRFSANPLASLGISNLDGITIPEVSTDETIVTERLHQAWLDWRVSVVPGVMDTLRAYLKSIKPEAAFSGNTIYPRLDNWHLRGVNPYRILKAFDISYCEGHNFPRWEDGVAVNNATSLIMGLGAGTNVLSGVWLPGTVLPDKPEQIELALGESLAFGGHVLSGIWALRMKGRRFAATREELSDPYFYAKEIGEPWAEYNRFLLENKTLYSGSRLDSRVALYHSEHSMAYDFGTAYAAFINAAQGLLQNQVPFDILFSQDLEDTVGKYGIVLLCSQRALSGRELEAFRSFTASGGRLIITGETGLYDRYRRQRRDYGLKDLCGASLFDRRPQQRLYRKSYGKGEVVFFPSAPELEGVNTGSPRVERSVPAPMAEVTDTLRAWLGGGIPHMPGAPPNVACTVFRLAGGGTAIHLLNYDNSGIVKDLRVILPESIQRTKPALRALSPDGPEFELLEQAPDGAWLLKKLKTYTCIVAGK